MSRLRLAVWDGASGKGHKRNQSSGGKELSEEKKLGNSLTMSVNQQLRSQTAMTDKILQQAMQSTKVNFRVMEQNVEGPEHANWDVIKEGQLTKKGEKRRNWKSRWFILKQKYLLYYDNSMDKKLKGEIKLVNCCVESFPSNSRHQFGFSINCRLRTYFICANSNVERAEWIDAINSCIENIERNYSVDMSSEPSLMSSPLSDSMCNVSKSSKRTEMGVRSKRALQKYYASEKIYVKNLISLKTYQVNILKDNNIVTRFFEGEINTIFLHVQEIFDLHTDIMFELGNAIQNWPNFPIAGTLFLKAKLFSVYIGYVANYSQAMEILSRSKKLSGTLVNFLKAQQQAEFSGHSLETLLVFPLQRPARYFQFIEELLLKCNDCPTLSSDDEKQKLEKAYHKSKEILDIVNKTSNLSQIIVKNMRVQSQLIDLDQNILNLVDPERQYIREGMLTFLFERGRTDNPMAKKGSDEQKDIRREDCYCFLFSDVFVYTSKARLPLIGLLQAEQKYRYKGHFFLHRVKVTDVADSDTMKNAFVLVDGAIQVTLIAESPTSKSQWLKDFRAEIANLIRFKKVFGVTLNDLMAQHSPKRDIPPFVEKAINFIITYALTTEGIFRESGSVHEINELKEQLDQGKDVDFPSTTDHHVVCGLLKLWFRELPEPLIPFALYEGFIKVADISDLDAKVIHLKGMINQLLRPNQFLLAHVISFFRLVTESADRNLMTKENLAIVFAPNILKPADPLRVSSGLEACYEVFQLFVEQYPPLFAKIQRLRRENKARVIKEQQLQERIDQFKVKEEEETEMLVKKQKELEQLEQIELDRQEELERQQWNTDCGKEQGVTTHSFEKRRRSTPDMKSSNLQPNTTALYSAPVSPLCKDGSEGLNGNTRSTNSRKTVFLGGIVHQGFLSKKGANRRNWKTRWFVLRQGWLEYYASTKEYELHQPPKGRISLMSRPESNFKCEVRVSDRRNIKLTPQASVPSMNLVFCTNVSSNSTVTLLPPVNPSNPPAPTPDQSSTSHVPTGGSGNSLGSKSGKAFFAASNTTHPFEIEIISRDRTLFVAAKNQAEMDQWIEMISACVLY